ncbi:hypothetical protein MRX96_049344 [Rhipicephalus microplus]
MACSRAGAPARIPGGARGRGAQRSRTRGNLVLPANRAPDLAGCVRALCARFRARRSPERSSRMQPARRRSTDMPARESACHGNGEVPDAA